MTLLLAAFLAAAPVPAPARVKVALPNISAVNLDPSLASFLGEHLAQQLKESGVDVVTSREISTLLGLERQKQLLGCATEAGSCMAELANALGADAVLLCDLAKLDAVIRINLKIISATDGRTLTTFSDQVSGENAAAEALTAAARQMAPRLRAALGRPELELADAGPSPLRRFWWAPVAGGAIAAGVGIVFYLQGSNAYSQLTTPHTPPLSTEVATGYRDSGPRNQALGVGLMTFGGIAAAAGAAMFLLGGSSSSVAVVPSPGGGGSVVVGGTFE